MLYSSSFLPAHPETADNLLDMAGHATRLAYSITDAKARAALLEFAQELAGQALALEAKPANDG